MSKFWKIFTADQLEMVKSSPETSSMESFLDSLKTKAQEKKSLTKFLSYKKQAVLSFGFICDLEGEKIGPARRFMVTSSFSTIEDESTWNVIEENYPLDFEKLKRSKK